MSFSYKTIALAAVLSLSALAANSATVAIGGTGSTGAGGFNSPAGTVDTNDGAYTQVATTPTSNWVWVNSPLVEYGTLLFTFTFDLTGYNLGSASLAGLWGVDNSGYVDLNGTTVSTLAFGYSAFTQMNAFSDAGATFLAGINTLTFHATNQGGPGAFRASVSVQADALPSAVPLPAGLPLLATGMAGLAALRRKRKA